MSATTGRIETYEDFVKVHGLLLAASGLPQSLHRQLFEKLLSETFDGDSYFQIEPSEEGRQRRLVLTSESMFKDSNVFLVDHAWTFRLSDACKQVLCYFSFSFLSFPALVWIPRKCSCLKVWKFFFFFFLVVGV